MEGTDRGRHEGLPSVKFEHFWGITPRRYKDMFPRNKRKDSDGKFERYKNDPPIPTVDIRIPIYTQLEKVIINKMLDFMNEKYGNSEEIIKILGE